MEQYEDALLEYSGVQPRISKSFTIIEMDGKPFRVRTFIVGPPNFGDETFDPRANKRKTLLLLHGYTVAGVIWWRLLEALSEKYRVIMVDVMSHGLNSKPNVSYGLESPARADEWLVEWITRVVDALP